MNPLDLSGPAFLAFYVCFVLLSLLALWLVQRVLEAGSAHDLASLDAYTVAHLRGGRDEALRVAVVALLDRGLLSEENGLLRAAPEAEQRVRRPLERAVLQHFAEPARADSVFAAASVRSATDSIESTLREQGLLPSGADRVNRLALSFVALLLLGGTAIAKISVALARGRHNIAFLVVLSVLACIFSVARVARRRTFRGERTLEELAALCAGLRGRASQIALGSGSYDLAMLVGVFGLAALQHESSASLAQRLFPAPASTSGASGGSDSSSGGSSSCGSSCGGGCGGGCGGCGS